MQQQSELPEGWSSIILEDFINIAARIGWKGLKRAEYTDSGPLMLAVKDILINGNIHYEGISEHLSDFRYDESPEIKLQKNDILVTKDGTIGKIGFVDNLNCKATVNSSILVVRPSSAIYSRYLFFYFRSPFFQKIVQMKITGSAVPHLFQKDIKKFQVLIPPLAEQHRIVSAIESLLARLDAANERLDRVPEILKRFRQSVLAAACDGRLTEGWREENKSIENAEKIIESIRKEKNVFRKKNINDNNSFLIPYEIPNSWNWTTIECISKSMKNGIYKKQEFYSDNGIACLRMYNIEDGRIVWKNIKRMNLSDDEIADYLLEPGDILVNRVNSRELVGKAAPIPDDIEPCIYESKNIRLKIFNQLILSKYVGFWFQVHAQNYFNFNAQQTVNMASINQQQLGSMPFPLPPLLEQHEIVRRVDALFALADTIEVKVAAARERTEKLRQSILSKAFSGKLVETEAELARREGRDYEAADVLLERIRVERGTGGKRQ